MTLKLYLRLVGASGLALLGGLTLDGGWSPSRMTIVHWVLIAFLVLGELMPIRLAGHDDEVNTSSAFSFALMATLGLAPAALAQATASVLADLRLRKSLDSTVFNVGQYTVSLAAAGATMHALSDLPREMMSGAALTGYELVVLALCGLVFFAINNTLAGTAYALLERNSILVHLREDLSFQAWTAALVLGFSPLVICVACFDPVLLPFLLLPLLAIYRSGRDARRSEHRASHDGLTQLPNRLLFRRRAEAAIRDAASDGHHAGVLLLDLDRFKEINDTLGHAYGDLLLQTLAARLEGSLRPVDTVARFGGDEFAVLLPAVDDAATVEKLAERLLTALHQPFGINGVSLTVGASIGVACFPEDGDDVDLLLQRADVAMYLAKGRFDGVVRYQQSDDQNSFERLSLAVEVRDVATRGELALYFQPQIDLVTGGLLGAEALMRWEHPERGLIPPDVFIPIAEHTGAIRELTAYALEEALGQCARWRTLGMPGVVSVNVTAQDVLDQELPQRIADMLHRRRLPAACLELELTETMLMADPERAGEILRILDGMGVTLAIDDFGTGYSSLAYLKRLPVDRIKIDRTFVMNMQHDASDAAIVASTIDLARNLGLRAVAEGIEDPAVSGELVRMGCTEGQGYAFARPLAADDFVAWAVDRRDDAATGTAIKLAALGPI